MAGTAQFCGAGGFARRATPAPGNQAGVAVPIPAQVEAGRTPPADPYAPVARLVARVSVAWLVAANLVGVLLAALLLFPGLNDSLAPFTYGRWVPVHLNAQLYGWCALPLVGLLLRGYVAAGRPGERHAALALAAWSGALLWGCGDWLAGGSSGKIFLDWNGADRVAFALALCLLWAVLAHHAWRPSAERSRTRAADAARLGLLVALLAVPGLMFFAAGPRTYPPVNPHSGGATGTSLFGSTLALLAIFAAVPTLLQRPVRPGVRRARLTWPLLAVGGAVFAVMDHGNASHHAAGQIAGLAGLFVGPWLIARDWRRFAWENGSRAWLVAAGLWGGLLVLDGWCTFLPGLSERLKFTNALVGHSHLAMAGCVTSLHVVLLLNLAADRTVRRAFAARAAFRVWQLGAVAQVAVLTWLGWREGGDPWLVESGAPPTAIAYAARGLAGGAMAAASVAWLFRLLRRSEGAKSSIE